MLEVVLVATSRADFGLLTPLAKALNLADWANLNFVVTEDLMESCSNAVPVRDFPIEGLVRAPLNLQGGSPVETARAFSRALTTFTDVFYSLDPDVILVLGDRYEVLAAVESAFIMRKRVGHISGGETTLGSIDDEFRWCISRLASLHLVSRPEHKLALEGRGISPESIKIVGYLASDVLEDEPKLTDEDLSIELGFKIDKETILVTYHPNSRRPSQTETEVAALLTALDALPNNRIVVTAANADSSGAVVNLQIQQWCLANVHRARFFENLGTRLYLNVMRKSLVVLGNSSSGLIEAPLVGTHCVNIGDRQAGRIPTGHVINCPFDPNRIADIIRRLTLQETASLTEKQTVRASDLIVGAIADYHKLRGSK